VLRKGFVYHGATALVDQGILIIEASRTHSDTPHSVGLIWTSDQPDARNLYLTTHNTHNRQTSMPPPGFEPTIPAGERPQTHPLDRAATESGLVKDYQDNKILQTKRQKEPAETIEEKSGFVRPERVDKWPNCMTA